jgi:putative RecB family exonuclease
MALELPRSLSPSSVSTFKDCPQSFKFAYVDRLPRPPSAAASKGTLVHKALEYLMVRPAPDRTLDAALTDLDRARASLSDDPDFTGLDLNEAEWRSFQTEAEQLVRKYFELEDPRTVLPIGLELKLSAKVGSTTVRGIIDRLELDANGDLVVTDYKTGSVPGQLWENSRLGGVHMYALLCERMLGRRPVQLLYLSKPEAIIATPTEQSIGGVERKTSALWTAIERACNLDDFRPKTGRLCDWCAYKPYCPAWGGDPERAVELRGPAALAPPLPLVTAADPASSPEEQLLPTG